MKHGIYYAYWEKEWEADYLYYVDKVSKLGFDILELGAKPLPDYNFSQITALRSAAKNNGLELTAGYGPAFNQNIGSPNSITRAHGLAWFTRLFEVMAQLDIHLLGGAIYSYWPVDFSTVINKSDDWKRSVEGMQILGPIAKQYNITLGMEVLNRFENHILNTAQEGVAFVKEIGVENVKVMLDTFHMNIEESSIGDAIRTAGNLLGHFHTGECNRMVPGKGRIPWKEIGDALKSIEYNGTVVMEPFVNTGGTVGQNIHVWRDISQGANEDQLDLDAKQALAFQRYMLDWK
ncbi:MAG: sugar phosphate isomerase/epimerase family protein [Lachnospiraceae bacterium]